MQVLDSASAILLPPYLSINAIEPCASQFRFDVASLILKVLRIAFVPFLTTTAGLIYPLIRLCPFIVILRLVTNSNLEVFE